MSKENLFDAVKVGVLDVLLEAKKVVGKEFKRTNPFGMVKATPDEIMAKFNTLSPEEKIRLFNQMGGK
jgi:hypothetical protein